jgi:Zn-dependent peptidase ImmA (M78 family)
MSQRIAEAIKELYQCAEIPMDMEPQHIVPLNELVGAYNLVCTELPALTSEVASQYLLRRGAILQPLTDTNQDPLAGYIYVTRSTGYIFASKGDPLVRRRFSVAHELGHYILHFLPIIERLEQEAQDDPFEIAEALIPVGTDEESEELPIGKIFPLRTELQALLPSYEQMEQDANQFAADVLMPETALRRLTAKYRKVCRGDDFIWRLATEMLVSTAAMRRRLSDLNLLYAWAGAQP